jgi:DNA-binding response OmpR family regulator
MPLLDGFSFCRKVRETSSTPIIIISAKTEEADKLNGLELGADDYVTKPFSLLELVARIRALLRRRCIGYDDGESTITTGPLQIDPARRTAAVDGADLPLTVTEFCLLKFLASNPACVFNRRELMEAAQGDFYSAYERTVDAHIGNIRKKAGDLAPGWSFIDTIHGVGYRFNVQKTS